MNADHIMKSDYKNSLELLKNSNIKFNIIFLDPPYKLNLINDCLNKIYEFELLNKDGIIVCEYEKENINTEYFELIKEKRYGSKNIKIYKCKI